MVDSNQVSFHCFSPFWLAIANLIITSRVSGRGHRIGAVCVCVCVCVCVSVRTLTAEPFDL